METNEKGVKEKKPRTKRSTKVVPIAPPSVQAPEPPKEEAPKKLTSNVPINYWEAQPDIEFAPPPAVAEFLKSIERDIVKDLRTITALEARIAEKKRMREYAFESFLTYYDIKRNPLRPAGDIRYHGGVEKPDSPCSSWVIPQPPKKVSTQDPE